MADDNCKQVNIPSTDNTPLDCPTFVLEKCVEVPEGNPFLLTNDNISLEEYHEKLIEKLITHNQRLIIVENASGVTSTYSLALNGNILELTVNGDVVTSVDLSSFGSGGLSEIKEVFTATQGQTFVTLSNIVATQAPVQVVVGGITLLEGVGNEYQVSGNIVAFTAPLQLNEIVQIIYKY